MSLAGYGPKTGSGTDAWLLLKLDIKVLCYTKMTKMSVMQLAYSKVAQPKPGAFRPQLCHWTLTVWFRWQTVRWKASARSTLAGRVPLLSGNHIEIKIGLVYMKEEEFMIVSVGHHNTIPAYMSTLMYIFTIRYKPIIQPYILPHQMPAVSNYQIRIN